MSPPPYRPKLAAVVAAWAGATLLYAILLMEQRQIEFTLALTLSMLRFGILAALGIPMWTVCERLLAARPSKIQWTLGHLAMAAVVLLIWLGIYIPVSALLYGQTMAERLRSIPPLQYLEFGLTYTLMAGGIVTFMLSGLLEAQRRREVELMALAQEAELRALKAQIRPHFLFNVLNSIYSLIGSRPEQAREMVDLVADLMRRTLDASEEQFVPIEWELQVVDRYLRIEKVRLGARLDAKVETEGLPPGAVISPLLLQPLVENAIKHGVGARPGPGTVLVQVRRDGDSIEFVVRDSGPGVSGEIPHTSGRGLSLTRRRLEAVYGADFSLELRNLETRGFEVKLRIPARAPRRDEAVAGAPARAKVAFG